MIPRKGLMEFVVGSGYNRIQDDVMAEASTALKIICKNVTVHTPHL